MVLVNFRDPLNRFDTSTPSVCPAIDSGSSLCPTKSSQDSSTHYWGCGSACRTHYLMQISKCFNQVSDVAKVQRAALEELLE